jgi:hypothetical protein
MGMLGKGEDMANLLANAFSLQMLQDFPVDVHIEEVSASEVAEADWMSVIGHPDTAGVLTEMLGREVAFNRASVSLAKGDTLFVAQVVGGRLPEGATTLPEGFSMKFLKVTLG